MQPAQIASLSLRKGSFYLSYVLQLGLYLNNFCKKTYFNKRELDFGGAYGEVWRGFRLALVCFCVGASDKNVGHQPRRFHI